MIPSQRTSQLALLFIALLAGAGLAQAQCQLLIRDSFRGGPRPHGGNGRLRDANIHDTLSGYWPQTPAGAQWISTNQSGLPTWAFAGSSLDPAEVDPLDPFNGTAFGEAPAAALLQFSAPPVAFTISAEAVMLFGSTSATYLGFTSNPAEQSNFETHGTLWMTLDGQGNWSVRANGNTIVAGGTAPISGTLNSGWLHMELRFDPATSTVSGRVMDTPITPVPVAVSRPFAYFAVEAHDSWNVLNNLSVFTGSVPNVAVSGPVSICAGASTTLTASSDAQAPLAYFWRRDGVLLGDGPQPGGSIVSGAASATLVISNASSFDVGDYECVVANACGISSTGHKVLAMGDCCPADLDDGSMMGVPDGGIDINDLLYFLAQYEAGNVRGDLDDGSGTGVRDGGVDINDLLYFIARYEAGC